MHTADPRRVDEVLGATAQAAQLWLDEIVLGTRLMVHAAEILTVPLLFPYV